MHNSTAQPQSTKARCLIKIKMIICCHGSKESIKCHITVINLNAIIILAFTTQNANANVGNISHKRFKTLNYNHTTSSDLQQNVRRCNTYLETRPGNMCPPPTQRRSSSATERSRPGPVHISKKYM